MNMNCPNHPEIELEWAILSNAYAGDVYVDADICYCPECKCVIDSQITVHE